MLRAFFVFLLLIVLLEGRENPFFPVEDSQDIPYTSNQTKNFPMLKRATLTLPSTARTIENIIIEYKNLDGSIAQKKVSVQNTIDWHLPIFISQSYDLSQQNSSSKKEKKRKSRYKKITSLKFIAFYAKENQLKIITKDKMLRNFLLAKPHRIVCDFKRDTDIGSYIKSAYKNSLFTKVRIGTHKGYYRVVIELDGYYVYHISKMKNGYLIKLL